MSDSVGARGETQNGGGRAAQDGGGVASAHQNGAAAGTDVEQQIFDSVLGSRVRQDSTSAEDLDQWLWECCQEYEAAGEVSDCMYHHAKGGLHGAGRVRMFLPALNKVLCSNRVSQMTKTYNDIEAVTRLLEEKEKDLELTARIGKELLGHNQKLEANVASLEAELRTANEKIIQLTHELTKKTELIQILTNDVDDSGSEPGTPAGTVNWDVLQRRLLRLEEENKSLRAEASSLASQTEECEAAEARLVAELASQLALTRTDLSGVSLDADRQREEAAATKAHADSLQEKLGGADARIAEITQENEELVQMVHLARETQCELATELADVKDKYNEVMNLLQETQETMRKQRKKSQPSARAGLLFPSLHTSLPTHNPDSLASELECSLFSELSLDSGIGASSTNLPNYKKVFETVRCASRAGSNSTADSSPGRYPTGTTSSQRPRMSSSFLPPQRLTRPALDSAGASDSECSDTEYAFTGRGVRASGGSSTAQELEAALRRLTPGAVAARRAALGGVGAGHEDCLTPDSIMSTGSSVYSGLGSWKLPDKLQIVKPIEGSATLHHWSELATPSLGGLLEERPGVKVRGGLELEQLGLELYTLSDLEEDEEVHPGKSFQGTGGVYTYTNSMVMHPDDNTSVTHSYRGSQMCTATSSRMSSVASTPAIRSRRNSTTTFSSSLGLAKMLNERGIKAVTPSTLPTPMFSPTATPANSPDHSPSSTPDYSRSSSPSPTSSYSPLGLPGFLMSSGAELLRRTLVGAMQTPRKSEHVSRSRSRPESAVVARRQLKGGPGLVEALERIGLEQIMSTTAAATPTTQTSTDAPACLGVPGTPGSGVLESRLSQLPSAAPSGRAGRQPRVRADLGTVPGQTNNSPSSSLGILSSMLFGRKGGLL